MGKEQARVLIVDDEAGMRHTLEAGLMQQGFATDDVEERDLLLPGTIGDQSKTLPIR